MTLKPTAKYFYIVYFLSFSLFFLLNEGLLQITDFRCQHHNSICIWNQVPSLDHFFRVRVLHLTLLKERTLAPPGFQTFRRPWIDTCQIVDNFTTSFCLRTKENVGAITSDIIWSVKHLWLWAGEKWMYYTSSCLYNFCKNTKS